MKYKIRSLSMRKINQTESVLVWSKGALFYKPFNGSIKFMFPWNVTTIQFENLTAFPILFWGIKGSHKLRVEDVRIEAVRWEAGRSWSEITIHSVLDNLNEDEIKMHLSKGVDAERLSMNEIVKTETISYEFPNLPDVSRELLPQSILDYTIK